jgi:SNF2 family DNA or RNA helicase
MENINYPFKTAPMRHQLEAWSKTNRSKIHALLWEMGTGKTKTAIDTIAYMYDQGWIDAAAIFAYKGTYENWADEIVLHLPSHINHRVALWTSYMNTKQEKIFNEAVYGDRSFLRILIMNVEALAFERSFKVAYTFSQCHRTIGIMDESTCIKNPSSKRTKAAWKIRDVCLARRIMTGSAVDNRPLDAWAQYEFLRPGCLGFSSYYAFRAQYAILVRMRVRDNRIDRSRIRPDGMREITTIKGHRNLDQLRASMSKISTMIKSDKCQDLPSKIYQAHYVDLTDDQRVVYEQMKKRAIIELKGSIVTAKIVLTKIIRLQQIACGFIVDDDGTTHRLPSNRLAALMSILDESREKGLIWANYRESIHEIEVELSRAYGKDEVRTYYGETGTEERREVRAESLRGAETHMRWLVSNQQTGGYGNNWTAFNLVIYYANSFDGELRNQSEARAHRKGQTGSVTYVDLVARGTVDEKILSVLKDKKTMAEAITQSNWEEWFR